MNKSRELLEIIREVTSEGRSIRAHGQTIYWIDKKKDIRYYVEDMVELAREGDKEEIGSSYIAVITKDKRFGDYPHKCEGGYSYISLEADDLEHRNIVNLILSQPYVEVNNEGYVYIWVDKRVVGKEYRDWEALGKDDFPFMRCMKEVLEPWLYKFILRSLGVPDPDDLFYLGRGIRPPRR